MKLHEETIDEIDGRRNYLFSKIYKKRKILIVLLLLFVLLAGYSILIDRANAGYTSKLNYSSSFKHYIEKNDEFSILVVPIRKYAPTEKIFAEITLKSVFNNEHNTDMNITYTIYENWLTGAKRYYVGYSECPITEKISDGYFLSYSTYYGRMEVDKDMTYLGSYEASDANDIAPEVFLEEYAQDIENLKSISENYFDLKRKAPTSAS